MNLEISDDLYAAIMSALRELERERRDPRYAATRKALLQAMLIAVTEEVATA